MADRLRYLIQLLGSLAILLWIPTNIGKAVCLLLWWLVTFHKLSRLEIGLYVIACGFFSFMNIMSLRQGIFSFSHPDLLGMPYFEFFMWGFYLLHTLRMLQGPAATDKRGAAWVLAICFALAFGTLSDQQLLLIVTALLLAAGLIAFHSKYDLAYTGYMVALGAAIEYTGVLSGQWSYPGTPTTGVPLWFITLWGGVGLLLYRLVLPLLVRLRGKGAGLYD